VLEAMKTQQCLPLPPPPLPLLLLPLLLLPWPPPSPLPLPPPLVLLLLDRAHVQGTHVQKQLLLCAVHGACVHRRCRRRTDHPSHPCRRCKQRTLSTRSARVHRCSSRPPRARSPAAASSPYRSSPQSLCFDCVCGNTVLSIVHRRSTHQDAKRKKRNHAFETGS
jgi:hypothetical protein